MNDGRRAELVDKLLRYGHGMWIEPASSYDRYSLIQHNITPQRADKYYIHRYDFLSKCFVVSLSPQALKELSDGT